MNDDTNSASRPGTWIPEVAVVVLLGLSIWGWVSHWPGFVRMVKGWAAGDDPGDAAIGLMFYGPILLMISFVLLQAISVFGLFAKRLPLWFRLLAAVPAVLGCLLGLAITYRAFSG